MSMEDYLKAKAMIEEELKNNPDAYICIGGGVSDATIEKAEKELSVKFPPTYRAFLKDFGNIFHERIKISGLTEPRDPDPEAYDMDVVRLTKSHRANWDLPDSYVVFYDINGENLGFMDTAMTLGDGENPCLECAPLIAQQDGYMEDEDYSHFVDPDGWDFGRIFLEHAPGFY